MKNLMEYLDKYNYTYESVAYGNSRAILDNQHGRKVVMIARSFSGLLIIAKKLGGYMAYYGYFDNPQRYRTLRWGREKLIDTVKQIYRIKKEGTGIVEIDEKEFNKMKDKLIIDEL